MDLILSKFSLLLANIIEFFFRDFHIVFNFTERRGSQGARYERSFVKPLVRELAPS
jgi:hypothetical protein